MLFTLSIFVSSFLSSRISESFLSSTISDAIVVLLSQLNFFYQICPIFKSFYRPWRWRNSISCSYSVFSRVVTVIFSVLESSVNFYELLFLQFLMVLIAFKIRFLVHKGTSMFKNIMII